MLEGRHKTWLLRLTVSHVICIKDSGDLFSVGLTAHGGTVSKLVTAVVVGYAAATNEDPAAVFILGLMDDTPPAGSQSFLKTIAVAADFQ